MLKCLQGKYNERNGTVPDELFYYGFCANSVPQGNGMKLLESGEMYLETILILSKRHNTVRSIDVAEEMGFSKASVSRAMTKLRNDKYIIIDAKGYIAFTESGRKIAEKIYERHTLLTEFIMKLGVDEETASADACKIEHDISDKTFEAIKNHVAEKS